MPGFLVALVLFFTVKQVNKIEIATAAAAAPIDNNLVTESNWRKLKFHLTLLEFIISSLSIFYFMFQEKLKLVTIEFLKPSLILLCLAGSIRNAGKYKQRRYVLNENIKYILSFSILFGLLLPFFLISDIFSLSRYFYETIMSYCDPLSF